MSRDAVTEIRERTDIVELINGYTPLKKTGRSFKGLCPFHQEKTPSFVVFPDSQNFHCFGCGKGGDLFTFFMEIEKLDFREALRELAEKAGVSLEATPGITPEKDERRQKLLAALDFAATYYHDRLINSPQGEPGRQLALQRGLDDRMIERFRLGFAPAGWENLTPLLRARNIDQEIAIEAGLLQRREENNSVYDRFRNRFMFPIADRDGAIVGFGARAMGDDQPKYLNSPQTPLFDKSSLLYGLNLAKESIRTRDQVVIVEGYMDVIAAHQFGHENVVAAMGTALTESQVGLIKRFSKRIVLALDSDAAGQMATLRSLESMPNALDHVDHPIPEPAGLIRFEKKLDAQISILQIPAGKDPDELLRNHPEQWDELVQHAIPFLDFYIDAVTSDVDVNDPRSKSAAFQRIAPLLRQVGDQLTQQHYIGRISGKIQLPEAVLWSELHRNQIRRASNANAPATSRGSSKRIRSEDYLTAVLLKHSSLSKDLLEEIGEDDLLDSRNREIVKLLKMDGADQVDAEVLITGLDENVAPHAEQLMELIEGTPSAFPGQIRDAATAALNGIRRERLEFLMRQLQSELSSAQQEKDVESLSALTSQMSLLATQKRTYDPAKSPYFKDSRDVAKT
ncbi:DNA primase [soil metagenome]